MFSAHVRLVTFESAVAASSSARVGRSGRGRRNRSGMLESDPAQPTCPAGPFQYSIPFLLHDAGHLRNRFAVPGLASAPQPKMGRNTVSVCFLFQFTSRQACPVGANLVEVGAERGAMAAYMKAAPATDHRARRLAALAHVDPRTIVLFAKASP